MRFIFLFICLLSGWLSAAQAASFTYIGTKNVDELNQVLRDERKNFLYPNGSPPSKSYKLPISKTAKNEVDLYKVEYDSVIPEQGNRPTIAFGLVAVPKIAGASNLPFLAYQHGTVFGKHEVPSYSFLTDNPDRYEQSYETRLAVAQFAGNGYVVFAADYFGMGDSVEPEGYLVKGSHQQACLDLYLATRDWLASNKSINQNHLFLSGWSQGGYVTMAFLEKLEEKGIPVTAASTAAAPTDLFASFNSVIYHPRPMDAMWLSTTFSLSTLAFENYYAKPGLVEALFKPNYVPSIRAIYYRTYTTADELRNLLASLARYDEKSEKYVSDIAMLLKDDFQNPANFASSEFGRIALQSDVYRWHFKTPVQMYYGLSDEAVAPRVATIAANYQKAMGNTNVVVAKSVANANHRATYLTASFKQLRWFNRLARQ
jgi:pimeloyl-ACP methyl ester carboxylesterase